MKKIRKKVNFNKPTRNDKEILKEKKISLPKAIEERIVNFLDNEYIRYIKNFYFKKIIYQNKKILLFCHFYLPDYKICIEYITSSKSDSFYEIEFLKSIYYKKNNFLSIRFEEKDSKNIEDIIKIF